MNIQSDREIRQCKAIFTRVLKYLTDKRDGSCSPDNLRKNLERLRSMEPNTLKGKFRFYIDRCNKEDLAVLFDGDAFRDSTGNHVFLRIAQGSARRRGLEGAPELLRFLNYDPSCYDADGDAFVRAVPDNWLIQAAAGFNNSADAEDESLCEVLDVYDLVDSSSVQLSRTWSQTC